jgi:hypothetical protein
MKLGVIKNITIPEIILLLVFIIYILFPIATPEWMKPIVRSSIGMLFMFTVTISLFVYTNPLLGVVYVFVAYEALRRSMLGANLFNTPDNSLQHFTNNQLKEDLPVSRGFLQSSPIDAVPFNDIPVDIPSPEAPHSFAYRSLEEEMVDLRSPIGRGKPLEMTSSSFVPVAPSLKNASLL